MQSEHRNLIDSMSDHPIISKLLDLTLTLDQAKVVLTMLDTIKNVNTIVSNDPNELGQNRYHSFYKIDFS